MQLLLRPRRRPGLAPRTLSATLAVAILLGTLPAPPARGCPARIAAAREGRGCAACRMTAPVHAPASAVGSGFAGHPAASLAARPCCACGVSAPAPAAAVLAAPGVRAEDPARAIAPAAPAAAPRVEPRSRALAFEPWRVLPPSLPSHSILRI